MSNEDKITETLQAVKSMSKWEKIFGFLLSSSVIGVIWWVAITSHVDAQQTIQIERNSTAIQSIRDTLPKIHEKGAISAETIRRMGADIVELKANNQKDRELLLDLAIKMGYVYDREKERQIHR